MNDYLLILGGVAYAIAFWIVCLRRPDFSLALVFASSPFQQDISGGGPLKFSIAEINLLLSLPITIFRARKWRLGPTFLPALGFIILGMLCSIPNWRDTTLSCLVQSGIYLILAVFVFASLARSAADYRQASNGFIIVATFLAVCILITRTPYVLGLHKNGVGSSIAAAVMIALEMSFHSRKRRWLYHAALGILTTALVLTLSRGAWLSALVGMLLIFILRRKIGQMVRALFAMAVIVAACWILLPQEDKEYATGFGKERWNIKLRYESTEFAMEKFQGSPIYGAGVGLRKEYDATNLALVTLAETGLLGIAAFGLIHIVLGWTFWRTQRQLRRDSLEFSALAIAVALIFGKLVHGMVDHYWSRGTLMAAWGAVGMAAWVRYAQALKRKQAIRARHLATREHSRSAPGAQEVLAHTS